jgi:hypothetical protein
MYVNTKIKPVETVLGMGEEDKKKGWRGEFKYDNLIPL